MSAFLVSEKHISILVGAWLALPSVFRPPLPVAWEDNDGSGLTGVGRCLLRENMASLAAHYHDKIDEQALADYYFDSHAADRLSIVEKIKAVHCYRYQASEHEGWEKSDARHFCEDLESALVHELPGYRDAAWGY